MNDTGYLNHIRWILAHPEGEGNRVGGTKNKPMLG
jgi:hypothetical protein